MHQEPAHPGGPRSLVPQGGLRCAEVARGLAAERQPAAPPLPAPQAHPTQSSLPTHNQSRRSRKLPPPTGWLQARARWCLSGTPLQNSVDDLFAYFRFLVGGGCGLGAASCGLGCGGGRSSQNLPAPGCLPQKFEPYCKQASFKEMLRDPINAGGAAAQRGYQRLHAALQVQPPPPPPPPGRRR